MNGLEAFRNAETVASPIGILQTTSNIFKIEIHPCSNFSFLLVGLQSVRTSSGQDQQNLAGSIDRISEGISQIDDSITRIREVNNKVTNLFTTTRNDMEVQADLMLPTTWTF